MAPEKIDLVYLWVDGNDKEWLKAKNYWLKEIKNEATIPTESTVSARWRDNDELKYSLRSAEMFAPWINHIYIITGFGQVPKWLNTKNKKITIVPHEQIMPADALPTFNSSSIEMCLTNIPNLSEHFLLANDDMFFGTPVTPDYFYDKQGRAIVWYGKVKKAKNIGFALENAETDFRKKVLVSINKIYQMFGKDYSDLFPGHNIDPYIKSAMIAARSHPLITHEMDVQVRNKFRMAWEYQRWFFDLYNLAHGYAKFKRVRRFKKPKHFIYNFIHRRDCKDSPVYCTDAVLRLSHFSPPLFCINDTQETTDEVRKNNHRFLEKKFPNKSSFEK